MLWDRETLGSPRRAIVWQDRRTADLCNRLRDDGHEDRVRELTGLRLDPYFSGTKLMWLAENEPHTWALVESGRYAIGTVDSYLIARMTRGTYHVTDVSNASPDAALRPRGRRLVRRAVRAVRRTPRRAARAGAELGRDRARPTRSRSSGSRCRSPASPATSSRRSSARPASTRATRSAPTAPGRSCSPTPARPSSAPTRCWPPPPGAPPTARSPTPPRARSSSPAPPCSGCATASRSSAPRPRAEAVASTVADSGGVVFVPALTGLGAPHWDPQARGLIVGLTRGTTRAHIVRATLEAIAFEVRDVLDVMPRLSSLRVDGGAAANDLLCQLQADQVGVPVERPKVVETTGLGAAFLAGLGVGVWESTDDLRHTWTLDRRFEPAADRATADAAHARWSRAVERAKGWAELERSPDDGCDTP